MALYIVGTPIGNLEDISLRALRVLREAGLIAAEDTRRTRKLLAHYSIRTPITSYYEHNKLTKLDYLLGMAAEGRVALVSEAGMPGISDPGYELIRAALERGIPVIPVPGPSAVTAALAVSGLPADRFISLGFLPRRAADRRRLLAAVGAQPHTIVAFEAPHRLVESLRDILEVLGDRPMAAARELTKLHEEVRRGRVSEIAAHYGAEAPRGEFTLVIAGAQEEVAPPEADLAERLLAALSEAGVAGKTAIAAVARATGRPKREIYQRALKMPPR